MSDDNFQKILARLAADQEGSPVWRVTFCEATQIKRVRELIQQRKLRGNRRWSSGDRT